jgi:hypothetical protein
MLCGIGQLELYERRGESRNCLEVLLFLYSAKLTALRGSKSFLKRGQHRVSDINNLKLRFEGTKGPIMENCYISFWIYWTVGRETISMGEKHFLQRAHFKRKINWYFEFPKFDIDCPWSYLQNVSLEGVAAEGVDAFFHTFNAYEFVYTVSYCLIRKVKVMSIVLSLWLYCRNTGCFK